MNPTAPATVAFAARSYDDPVVRALVAEVQQEYAVRYGGHDGAVVQPGEFDPPHGLFLVGFLDGEPVAIGGWRRLADKTDDTDDIDTAEIKRMYVVRRARRRGVARALLAELEQTAAQAGVRRLVLNTGTEQPEAVALYEVCGYHPVPGFGHYADAPKALFYGKSLSDHSAVSPG